MHHQTRAPRDVQRQNTRGRQKCRIAELKAKMSNFAFLAKFLLVLTQ